MDAEVLIVGAGLAGLSCARTLHRAGQRIVLLEKSAGLGGRAATRRVEGQPVDHGLIFYHGADSDFLEALQSVEDATPLPGWPLRVRGTGAPCKPEAFFANEQRLAFAEGVNTFPKHLARGLDIRRRTRVISVEQEGNLFRLRTEDDTRYSAPTVVVTVPVEQARELLDTLSEASPDLDSARSLMTMISSEPCLTLMAGYSTDRSEPEWDVHYPEDSSSILLIAHDSSKRRTKRFHTLVCQSRSRWSRERLSEDPSVWSRALLDETARLVGAWAAEPQWTQVHRWRLARIEPVCSMTSPFLISFPSNRRLGLAGEAFAPGGGAEAAWVSGRRLARRILGEGDE